MRCLLQGSRRSPGTHLDTRPVRSSVIGMAEIRSAGSHQQLATTADRGCMESTMVQIQWNGAHHIRYSAVARSHPTESKMRSSREPRARARPLIRDRDCERLSGCWRFLVRRFDRVIYAAGSAALSSFRSSVLPSVSASTGGEGFGSMLSISRSSRGASRHKRSRSYCRRVSGSKT